MPTSPPCSPRRRVLHERTPSERNRLQIRPVPYSPPRLCSEDHPPVSPSRSLSNVAQDWLSFSNRQQQEDHGKRASVFLAPGLHDPLQSHPVHDNSVVPTVGAGGDFLRLPLGTPPDAAIRGPSPSTSSLEAATPPNWTSLYESPARAFPPPPGPLDSSSASSSPSPSPRRRASKVVAVNLDKTFSLLPQSNFHPSATTSSGPQPCSPSAPAASSDHSRSNLFGSGLPSLPRTPFCKQPLSSGSLDAKVPNPNLPSSRDHRLLRRVHTRTVDQDSRPFFHQGLPTLNEDSPRSSSIGVRHLQKQSRYSSYSLSTASETSNYKTYASPATVANSADTDVDTLPPAWSPSDADVTGGSSAARSFQHQQHSVLSDAEPNYVVLHDSSSASSAVVGKGPRLRLEYSRESLLVPPLRPTARSLINRSDRSTSGSRYSIRTASLASFSSSVVEDATSFILAGAPTVHMPRSIFKRSASRRTFNTKALEPQWPKSQQHQLIATEREGANTSAPCSVAPARSPLAVHLSKLAPILDLAHARSARIAREASEPPHVAHRVLRRDPNGTAARLVRDHDEHGDGLADLERLHHRPSRSRLYSLLSSHASDRNIWSSCSSQSTNLRSSIPAWARVYYGSGEHRFLAAQPSADSLRSQYKHRSQGSFLRSQPPNEPAEILQASSRTHHQDAASSQQYFPGMGGDVDNEITRHQPVSIARTAKKQTSSIWSPHLRQDRRAKPSNFWEAQSAEWSGDGATQAYSRMQPIFFIAGFVFPFAWMFASFLPIAPRPIFEVAEVHSTSRVDREKEAQQQVHESPDVHRYGRARWWRNLNRAMSIVGLIVIGAIIALVVTGSKQQWTL
ncbi:hypothetical protein RJ55_02745 [Drechmeria coniospora]|nr:hypothetical protein RJ55_02745 [Drechmeria coniospora]